MKRFLSLFGLLLLLVSCKKEESYKEGISGKWEVLGSVFGHVRLDSIEIYDADSITVGDLTMACTYSDSAIHLPASKYGAAETVAFHHYKNFLLLNYSSGFSLLLNADGKALPEVSKKVAGKIVGNWKKENHRLQIGADGLFALTGAWDCTYSFIDEGLLKVVRTDTVGFPLVNGSYRSIYGKDIGAHELYEKTHRLVPYSLQGNSLTINYDGDEVIYTRE